MVGSRNYSAYGEKMTRSIASGLAQAGYVIVSGMAIGIDTIAQNEAIENGGGTVAVLGSGIDYCYPARNKKLYEHLKNYHLVISEYPGDIVPESRFFPIRNRIIAGISKTLVITEAEPLSGTSTTAALALNGNTDVMCVPYLAGSHSECNRLIAAGATLVEEVEDVINNMSRY
jgi:DNA processing protein